MGAYQVPQGEGCKYKYRYYNTYVYESYDMEVSMISNIEKQTKQSKTTKKKYKKLLKDKEIGEDDEKTFEKMKNIFFI
mgnify:CR=1 FL=1